MVSPDEPSQAEKAVRTARALALRLLAPAPLTCHQLASRLRSRGVDPEVAAVLIDELTTRRYLDDGGYARQWIERRRQGCYGRRRIAAELRQRGVPEEVAATALAEEAAGVELAAARAAAARQLPRLAGLEPRRAQGKLARHLQNRGFGAETIGRVLDGIDLTGE
jgi:regulatory protein